MIPRTLGDRLLGMAKKFPVISVTGPRQSGKTTLIRAVFPEHRYFSLENLDERSAVKEDPRGFLRKIGKRGIIIDEAQRVPELFSYLQEFVDSSDQMGRFILSGSQNFLLMESITQSLAGRASVQYLYPFTREELKAYVGFQDMELDRFLFQGMFPAIYDREIHPTDYFPSYLATYVERDVRALRQIGDLHVFSRFLRLCANRVGQILNLTSLGSEAGIDAKSVLAWISVLEASFIVFLLPSFHRNFNKRIVKSPKLFFNDTGLVCSLLGLNSHQQLEASYLRGRLFENFIVSEIRKMSIHAGIPVALSYWRDNTGNEIDLVIEKGLEFSAVEIKSGETVASDFFRNLQKFQSYSNLPVNQSFLVYGGEKTYHRKFATVLPWTEIDWLLR